MDPETIWAGVDLGQTKTHVCLVDDAGLTLREETCESTVAAISQALVTTDGRRAGLIAAEAGSGTHIVRKLRDAGYPVSLFEARKASRFLSIRRNKTDEGDARGLADLARLGRHTVSQVHLKSLECQQLRGQLSMRHRLVKVRVIVDGAIRSRLALYGRRISRQTSADLMRSRVLAELASLKAEEGIDLSEDVKPLLAVAHSLRKYVTELDKRLEKKAKRHPVCKRLMEVTGVGPICALSFYSAIDDPHRFAPASGVAAYLGLAPRRYQSGDVSYTTGITKTGNSLTRSHLVTAAMVFASRGPDSELKKWAAALRERIGGPRSRIALARKLSIILLTMWKTGAKFEPYPSRR